MIYAVVSAILMLSYGTWQVNITHKYVWFLFWVAGFSLVLLVPQSDLRTENDIRFVMINFTVFVLFILHGINFSNKIGEKAVYFTVASIWQMK